MYILFGVYELHFEVFHMELQNQNTAHLFGGGYKNTVKKIHYHY